MRDLTQAKRNLDEQGYCVIEGAMAPDAMARVRKLLQAEARSDIEAGAWNPSRGSVQNVSMLVNRAPEFVEMVQHPVAMELGEHLLGEDFLCSSFGGKVAHPDPDAEVGLHHDQGYVPAPMPPYPVASAMMWFVSDFTAGNGATLVVPGSHREGRWPGRDDLARAVALSGPAGTLALWDSRTWHATGVNRSAEPRWGILAYYCRPWIRQQVNQPASVEPWVLDGAGERLKTLLGFKPYLTLGAIHRPAGQRS